jgi:hypothetical protein
METDPILHQLAGNAERICTLVILASPRKI